MQEAKDLKISPDEKTTLGVALSAATGFDVESAFKSVGSDWFFLPEAVCLSPAAALALAEYVVAHP